MRRDGASGSFLGLAKRPELSEFFGVAAPALLKSLHVTQFSLHNRRESAGNRRPTIDSEILGSPLSGICRGVSHRRLARHLRFGLAIATVVLSLHSVG
jgi:hypothetical protein